MNGRIATRYRKGLLLAAIAMAATLAAPGAHGQGLSWELLGPTGSFRYEPIGADSSGVLYAARYRESGVHRSTDRGITWELAAPHAMAGFAASASAVYVVDGAGRLQRSTDRGTTWTRLPLYSAKGDSILAGIAASPDGALYAMTRVFFPNPAELLRSTDEGQTWITLMPPGERGLRILGFAADGSLFIIADETTYRSSDQGDLWQPTDSLTAIFGELRFDRSGTLYSVGGRRLHSSTDHGVTWTPGDSVPTGLFSHFAIADDGAMVIAAQDIIHYRRAGDTSWRWRSTPAGMPMPTALVAVGNDFFMSGTSGTSLRTGPGILRSTDGGATFRQVGAGLPGPAIHAVSALGDSVIFATTSAYGRFRYRRATAEWEQLEQGPREVSTGPDGALYVVTSRGYERSTDGGLTWLRSDTLADGWLGVGRAGRGGVFAAGVGTFGGLWITEDFGRTWERLDSTFVEEPTAIAFDSSGGILVGTRQAGLYRYDPASGRVMALDARVSSVIVTDITVAPDGTIYVATDGVGVRRSDDGGVTFVDARGGLPSLTVRALVATRRGDVVAATDAGLVLTRTKGAWWGFEGVGIPEDVTSISLDPSERIVAGTIDGVYLSRESAASAPLVVDSDAMLRVAPNPARDLVAIEHGVRGVVRVLLVNAIGRIVATIAESDDILETRIAFDASGIPPGAYRIVVESDGGIRSAALVVIR